MAINDLTAQQVVYTHALPDGTVFYVGRGQSKRATDFHNRTAKHKAIVNRVGRKNVVVEKFMCCQGEAYTLEIELLTFHVSAGAPLVNVAYGCKQATRVST